jgi:hypothetical protein
MYIRMPRHACGPAAIVSLQAPARILVRVENTYFALTEAFNRHGPIVALASGQAVVYYRIAIMSKDGDWVLRESPQACAHVLEELERHGAR